MYHHTTCDPPQSDGSDHRAPHSTAAPQLVMGDHNSLTKERPLTERHKRPFKVTIISCNIIPLSFFIGD